MLTFHVVPSQVGCTLEEARATLTTLAHFHALSIAVTRRWKTPGGEYVVPEDLSFVWEKTLFDANGPAILGPAIPLHCEIMRRLGHPEAAVWLEAQAKDIARIMAPEDVSKCGPLACLIHADCWNNNMMYRKEQSVDMRLIDWQITRLGHPLSDCFHFLFTSTSPELRANHFTQLMADYFDTLKQSLSQLDIHLDQEGYTEGDFRSDVKKRLPRGFFIAFMVLPIILDDTMISDIDQFNEEDAKVMVQNETNMEDVFNNMAEKMNEHMNMFTPENLMKKGLLCHRMCMLLHQVLSILQRS